MSETTGLPVNDAPAPDDANKPADAAPSPVAPVEKKPDLAPWQDKLIASSRKIAQQERERAAGLEAELTRLRAAQPPGQIDPNDPGEIERRAVERATIQVRQENEERQFAAACNSTADRIRTEYGQDGFLKAAQGWQNAGLNVATPAHRELLSLLTEVDDGHKLYHDIGSDPDFAAHLLEMSPRRAAFEIAKRLPAAQARELRAEAATASNELPTAAAAPVTDPVAGAAAASTPAISSAPRPPSQPAATRGGTATSRDIYDPKVAADTAKYFEERQRQREQGRR